MTETTDWASATAILVAGLILGSMFVYFFARRRTAVTAVDVELRDLEAKRDSLVEQLRGDMSPEERTRLELETAQVLRAIDAHTARARETAPPAVTPSDASAIRRATAVGFAWGAGSVLILAALAYFVMRAAEPREQADAGVMQQPPSQQPQADPVVAGLEAIVRESPDNLQARLELAQAYLERDHLMGVFEQTQYVLTKSPRDGRALTYQALVRMAMGQQPEAAQMLRQATESDPNLLDAWVGLAWVHMHGGQEKEAEAAIAEAMRRRPDEKARLEQVLAQMKSQVAAARAGQQAPAGGLPADHPPIAPPPAAADARGVRVTLELGAPAGPRSGVIFVIARAAGVAAGPPIAVKRLPATLPVTFDLTSADSMMGQPLPENLRIEARLDSDGDAATRTPGDPSAVSDGVAIGSAVKLALK